MRTHLLLLAFVTTPLLASAHPGPAQTSHPAPHHTATAVHHTAVPGCSHLPELSPKIPALPAASPCPKPLYTITRRPDLTLDYASPLLSPETRDKISAKPATFSLDYVDTHIGAGPLAQPHKWYTVKYTGYLPDGTIFDASDKHPGAEPISFPYGEHRVIEGWDTGFDGMHIGGKRRLFIPFQLAYGEAGHPPVIPSKSMLVFDIELVSQSDTQPAPPRRPLPPQPIVPQHAPAPSPSPAGTAASPPVTSSTPAASTQPAHPSTTPQPKQ